MFAANQKVVVSNKSRMDRKFQGRVGTVIEVVSTGYVRVVLDARRKNELATALLHPESLEVAA